MENLHWQLSVLSKAVHYKNLSGAAAHVGLSQPQLSRIVSRLEGELNVVLLDRAARRKSGWTKIAFKIADTYVRSSRKLTQSLQQLQTDDQIHQLHIGILEGLIPLASDFCQQIFDQSSLQMLEVDVYDLSELEERFDREELDLIFTCREPGKHKYKYVKNLGYQVLDKRETGSKIKVMSPFEYSSQSGRKNSTIKDRKILISNSLAVRRLWIEEFGGAGVFPSEVRRKKTGSEGELPVYLIASDVMSPVVWQKLEKLRS